MLKYKALFLILTAAASARKCKDLKVPVSLTAENYDFDIQLPTTKIDAANLALNIAQQGRDYAQQVKKGVGDITKKVSGQYSLAATYCEPDHGPGDELQILTHGVAFDRRYWDLPSHDYNYSYVKQAVDDHGYSTLTWDRLGVGASSKGDPISEIQVFLEIAALHELTTKAKGGNIDGISKSFDKVVHIGHSFGSVMTYALASSYPSLTEAIVLTGFSHVPNYIPLFAVGNNFIPVKDAPLIAAHYPEGYVATASATSLHINFFPPSHDFDPYILEAAFNISQPATPGELLTVGAPLSAKSAFKGSVLVITGENDLPFCGGDCKATASVNKALGSLLDVSKDFFPNATRFNATMVPGGAHGLNFGYSQKFTYDSILDFLS